MRVETKIGYPCVNRSIGCTSGRVFRLKSYSEQRLIETVDSNLNCLLRILEYNVKHKLLFFRITSNLVPFASHPICEFDWQNHFKSKFKTIGNYIRRNDIRISMHPDQFTLINSIDNKILRNSIKELAYHAQVLDLMKLDASAKIQIHVGGAYSNKEQSIQRFIKRFLQLDDFIKRRLVIENDDRLYSLKDCLRISTQTTLPILFDTFHHQNHSAGESISQAFKSIAETWSQKRDGAPMIDYSSQMTGGSSRQHAESIDMIDFRAFLEETRLYDFDLMLEIKDKEKSALQAVKEVENDPRFRAKLSRRETERKTL